MDANAGDVLAVHAAAMMTVQPKVSNSEGKSALRRDFLGAALLFALFACFPLAGILFTCGTSCKRFNAHRMPLRARALSGLICKARSIKDTLARGLATEARISQGSSSCGANTAACSAQRRAALRSPLRRASRAF